MYFLRVLRYSDYTQEGITHAQPHVRKPKFMLLSVLLFQKRKTQVNQSVLPAQHQLPTPAPYKENNPALANQQMFSITSLLLTNLVYKNLSDFFSLLDWMLPDS